MGEIECMTRILANLRSEGEPRGDPEGEQKGESKKREGGEGAGGMGDPGVTEVGGEWGITGERGVLARRAEGEVGERSVAMGEVFMWEKLIGESKELGRVGRVVGE